MQDNDLLQLRKEIALRGRIIETIVSANEELRAKNSALVSFIQSKAGSYSPSEIEMLEKIIGYSLNGNVNAYPDASYSHVEKGKGTTEFSYSLAENEKASPDVSYSHAEKGKGTTELSYSYVEKDKGITEASYSVAEKVMGITDVRNPVSGKGKGITNVRNPADGNGKVTHTPDFAFRVNVKLHLHHKGRRSALDATTALLKHIYNGGDCGYPALKKVTHLSTGGLGKRLMSLTKKGLIKRTGLQKLALTESALNLLGHAYDGSGKP